MSNVLSHAVTDTIHLGRKAEKEDFHIALTGTEDYIPHMGMVALTVHAHNEDMPICYHFFVNHLTDEEKGKLEKAAQIMQSPLKCILLTTAPSSPFFSLTAWLPFSIVSWWLPQWLL